MPIGRVRRAFPCFAYFLVICVTLVSGSRPVFAQIIESSDGQTHETPPVAGAPLSAKQLSDDQQQAPLRSVICGLAHLGECLKDLAHDQAGIWTSPLRLSSKDALWLVPFAAGTGVALHYDAQAQQDLGIDKTRIDTSETVSDVGLYGSIAGGGGLYLLGLATHNDHLAETGRLGEEAIINSLLVVEALKLATNRERPDEGNGRGGFWPHGTHNYELDSSFPSGHAAVSWSFARVIASQYPTKPVQISAYAFALAISASRVTARKHFPSDVLVGSTFGYLIGGYVVHHHATGDQASALMTTPVLEQSTRTYGLNMEFTPGDVNFGKAGRLIGRLKSTR